MNILMAASLVSAGAGAVLLFVPKAKQYGPLGIALGFILFGLSDVTSGHDVAYGIGMFVIAGILITRFAVERASMK
jgi:hypothetical protein